MSKFVFPPEIPVVSSLPPASEWAYRLVVYNNSLYYSDGTSWYNLQVVSDADTVDGYHASQISSPNTIPVSDVAGQLSPEWLPIDTILNLYFSTLFVLNPVNANTRYIPYVANCTALTTLALAANRIYYIPFVPLKNITLTSLAVEVTTASAGMGQIGVYNTANFRPSSLLAYVAINTGTTGVKSGTVKNLNLKGGQLYWLALINSSAATIRAVAVGGISPILGIATGGAAYNTHYYQAGSGGVLPSTAGTLTNGTGSIPAIYITFTY